MKKLAYLPVKMSPELKARLQARASQLDRSAGWLVRRYIEEGLTRDAKKGRNK